MMRKLIIEFYNTHPPPGGPKPFSPCGDLKKKIRTYLFYLLFKFFEVFFIKENKIQLDITKRVLQEADATELLG
jgi:hypothetical protein